MTESSTTQPGPASTPSATLTPPVNIWKKSSPTSSTPDPSPSLRQIQFQADIDAATQLMEEGAFDDFRISLNSQHPSTPATNQSPPAITNQPPVEAIETETRGVSI